MAWCRVNFSERAREGGVQKCAGWNSTYARQEKGQQVFKGNDAHGGAIVRISDKQAVDLGTAAQWEEQAKARGDESRWRGYGWGNSTFQRPTWCLSKSAGSSDKGVEGWTEIKSVS